MFEPTSGVLNNEFEFPRGIECVVYLAQSPYYRPMDKNAGHLWGVNAVSAIKVAELARRSGAKRFIYASTGNVYSPSFFPIREDSLVRRDDWYALSKLHAEEALALFKNDMSVTAARIFGVYGPGQTDKLVPNLVQSIRSGVSIKLAPNPYDNEDDDGLRISLCYIEDVVDIFTQLITREDPEVINVAGAEVLNIRSIALAIGARLGISPQFEIGNQPRAFDLVADVTKLIGMFDPEFTPFVEGIRRTLQV